MLIPLFTILHEITILNPKISLPFSPNIYIILPESGLSYCF